MHNPMIHKIRNYRYRSSFTLVNIHRLLTTEKNLQKFFMTLF